MNRAQNPNETACCPTRQELNDFLMGRSSPVIAEALGSHVATCPACQQVLAECEINPSPLIAALRESLREPPLDDVECARVVAHAVALLKDIQSRSTASDQPGPSGGFKRQERFPD